MDVSAFSVITKSPGNLAYLGFYLLAAKAKK